jgi:type II secretory pathway component PulC
MPLQKAIETCYSLGETLWSYKAEFPDIKHDLGYLSYQGKYSESQKYWIAPVHNTPSTINADGKVQKASVNTHLPALCTQSAPYSNSDSQDTSSRWQVSVHSNNEYLTG